MDSAAKVERVSVVIAGGGIAGLAAARALMRAGIDDIVLLELDDTAGGNARGHRLAGIDCPLGAHYLPVPGDNLPELREWLAELGLMRHEHGRWLADERHLCHAPQERVWVDGVWHEGLLPAADTGSAGAAQVQRLAALIRDAQRRSPFALPMVRGTWTAQHAALDAQTFAAWLAQHGLDDERLLGYLDYTCRDDYGAGIATVSAWAGLHYFGSRHGFRAPDDNVHHNADVSAGKNAENNASHDANHNANHDNTHDGGVFTWPEGNARLSRALAAQLGTRLRTGVGVTRIESQRGAVTVDAWDAATSRVKRYEAAQVVVALPLHVASRAVADTTPGAALQRAAARVAHAPWLVANLQLRAALDDRSGAAPAWDNVIHTPAGRSDALGYVDALHQSLSPARNMQGTQVITAYWALGRDAGPAMRAQRQALLTEPWQTWAQRVVADLAQAHPDLPGKVERVDLARYGHAMVIPTPGVRSLLEALGLHALRNETRVHLAHGDLAGYSVFEEAFTLGHRAGLHAAALLRGKALARG